MIHPRSPGGPATLEPKAAKAAAAHQKKEKTAETAGKTKPQAAKSAPTKKIPAKSGKGKTSKVGQGDQLYCDVCGLVVTVDEARGCAACDIICCGSQMQPRR